MHKPEWNENYNCPQSVVDDIDETLMGMVKEGLLDLFVDENGELMIALTSKGNKERMGM